MKKKNIISVILAMMSLAANAQSGTNSPYSQYGFGVMSDQSLGYSRGMGGLSLGLRGNNIVNMLNPASYSDVDSLTMIFDLGLSGQVTNFEENGKRINAQNSDLEYAVALFRLKRNVGLSAGVVPYTNIGYSYSETEAVNSNVTTTKQYSGTGGLHQAYVGLGWNIYKGLSLGANFSYLWGRYERNISTSNSDAYINTMLKSYRSTVNSYKFDIGLQWQHELDKKNVVVLGATYSHGHKLGSDLDISTTYTNSQTGVSNDTTTVLNNAFAIPHSYGIGFAWKHSNKFLFGVDYSLQKWGELEYPNMNYKTGQYECLAGGLMDRSKITIGGEWVPDEETGSFLERIHYRLGAYYATPYVKINGKDGPKEYSLSFGFGVPIQKSRSMFNLSAQWVRSSSTDLVTENMFRINLGLTFAEGWFMKWKVQ